MDEIRPTVEFRNGTLSERLRSFSIGLVSTPRKPYHIAKVKRQLRKIIQKYQSEVMGVPVTSFDSYQVGLVWYTLLRQPIQIVGTEKELAKVPSMTMTITRIVKDSFLQEYINHLKTGIYLIDGVLLINLAEIRGGILSGVEDRSSIWADIDATHEVLLFAERALIKSPLRLTNSEIARRGVAAKVAAPTIRLLGFDPTVIELTDQLVSDNICPFEGENRILRDYKISV